MFERKGRKPINNRLKTDKINATLKAIHLSLVQQYFSGNSEKVDTKAETGLSYLTGELTSVHIHSKITRKTGTTSQKRRLITLDIKSGGQVELEQLICFKKAAAKPPLDDRYKVYIYRKNVFVPKIF